MNRKTILTLILFVSALCSSPAGLGPHRLTVASADRVHNRELGLSYATIQLAINDPKTSNGDTILVDSGTYYENVKVTKAVSLIGESEYTTIVNGMGLASVLELDSNNITVTGFTLRNSAVGWAQGGITLGTFGDCNVSGNSVTDNYYGIWLESSSNSVISGNNLENNGYGIALYSSSNLNHITRNNVTSSPHAGILLSATSQNEVSANNIKENEYGVELVSSSNNTISENDIVYNSHGVALHESSDDNEVFGNNLRENGWGFEMYTSFGNAIHNNNFINNTPQVYLDADFVNVWDGGYPEGGNYWNDYNGADACSGTHQNETGSDGIGDSPYSLNSNNADPYPLMGTFKDFTLALLPYSTGNAAHVSVISNSTVSQLQYMAWLDTPNKYLQPGQILIRFSTSQQDGTSAFCRMAIPRAYLNASSYTVLIDGNPVNVTQLPSQNPAEAYLYVTYTPSDHEIIITVPEFPIAITPLAIITATVILINSSRKKPHNH